MAKAWVIEGIRPDQSLRERARLIIITKFREAFFYRVEIAISEDPEVIHNMRVSLRRLWAAMTGFSEYFSYQPKYPRLARRTRRLARRLGKVRDLDVLIELLQKYREKAQPTAEVLQVIEQLVSDCHRRRAKQHTKLLNYLTKLTVNQFEEKFLAFFYKSEEIVKNDEIVTSNINGKSTIFSTALDDFYAHQPIDERCDAEELHILRIAAKKLRYSIEFFETCYEQSLASYLNSLRDLQELLGDIHDCDVMVTLLSELPSKKGWPEQPALTNGIQLLISDFQKKREVMSGEFLTLWQEQFRYDFHSSLSKILNQAVG